MPKILDHQEAGLRRTIRDALAIDPLLTVTGVCKVVEAKIKRPVDPRYIKRLLKKVTGEMAVVADREKVEDRISYLRERNRIICDELFRMAFPGPNVVLQPSIIDRRKALEAIARIEANQAKLEMDFGLFTRELGRLNIDHRMKPLDEQTLGAISAAWKMWGPTPQMRKLESQPVLKVEAKVIKDEPANNTTKRNDTTIPAVTRAGLVSTE